MQTDEPKGDPDVRRKKPERAGPRKMNTYRGARRDFARTRRQALTGAEKRADEVRTVNDMMRQLNLIEPIGPRYRYQLPVPEPKKHSRAREIARGLKRLVTGK